jgi:topoisomerase-4 subunit A
LLSLSAGAQVLPPVKVLDPEQDRLAVVSNEGRLLVFAMQELPQLSKGKGNKLINIPAARAARGEECVVAWQPLAAHQGLVVLAGRRHLTLNASDLTHYVGERGRRGTKLPRGFQNVDGLRTDES